MNETKQASKKTRSPRVLNTWERYDVSAQLMEDAEKAFERGFCSVFLAPRNRELAMRIDKTNKTRFSTIVGVDRGSLSKLELLDSGSPIWKMLRLFASLELNVLKPTCPPVQMYIEGYRSALNFLSEQQSIRILKEDNDQLRIHIDSDADIFVGLFVVRVLLESADTKPLPHTKLVESLSESATQMKVAAKEMFATAIPFDMKIEHEFVTVTKRNNNDWQIDRGQKGSAAVSHDAGIIVEFNRDLDDAVESNWDSIKKEIYRALQVINRDSGKERVKVKKYDLNYVQQLIQRLVKLMTLAETVALHEEYAFEK